MATHKDAELILKLYDLRREAKMRDAREFILLNWFPKTADEVARTLQDPETSWKFRQFTTYWEMACALVNNGALDSKLFDQANGEHYLHFAKLSPLLAKLREKMGPRFLSQIETCIRGAEGHEQRLEIMKKRVEQMANRG